MKQQSRRRFIKLAAAGAALAWLPFIHGCATLAKSGNTNTEKFLQACKNGELDTVKKLVTSDPDLLMAKDSLGLSGFAIALLSGHKNIGDLLKESGYQPDLHETVLDLNWDRYNELVGEATEETQTQINADHPIGGTLMWAAAAGGAGTSIWRVYANCGDPNVNTKGKKGSSPLQIALRYPDLRIAELTAASLLSNNTDPNPALNAEMPPLHIAAERGSYELVEMLIRLGADVKVKNKQGKYAVQLAENSGHEVVADLLKNHTQVSRTCRTSRTAYDAFGKPYVLPDMSAVPCFKQGSLVGQAHRNLEGVTKTLTNNPLMAHSISMTSEWGIEAGAHMGNKGIVEVFIKNGAPYSLPTAVMMNDFTTVRRQLDEDPDRIHERGAHDFALLWYPVIGGGNVEMMQLLLERGADIEQQHYLGTTALHWAARRAQFELVELLVEHGADVNREGRKFNGETETPIMSTKDEKIAAYLKSKGAK